MIPRQPVCMIKHTNKVPIPAELFVLVDERKVDLCIDTYPLSAIICRGGFFIL